MSDNFKLGLTVPFHPLINSPFNKKSHFGLYEDVINATVPAQSYIQSRYDNGSSGLGATLINTAIPAHVLVVDLSTPNATTRILVKDMWNPAYNGIYVVQLSGFHGTNWQIVRSLDMSTANQFQNGALVYVATGFNNQNTTWQLSFTGPMVVGTTNITFTQYIT